MQNSPNGREDRKSHRRKQFIKNWNLASGFVFHFPIMMNVGLFARDMTQNRVCRKRNKAKILKIYMIIISLPEYKTCFYLKIFVCIYASDGQEQQTSHFQISNTKTKTKQNKDNLYSSKIFSMPDLKYADFIFLFYFFFLNLFSLFIPVDSKRKENKSNYMIPNYQKEYQLIIKTSIFFQKYIGVSTSYIPSNSDFERCFLRHF